MVLLAVAGCKGNGKSTDTRSSMLKDPALKVKFLDEYAMGPTTPLAAEFHIVYHDNSGGLIPGSDDYEIIAAVKVKPDDVSRWSEGCESIRTDPRPSWAKELVEGLPEFATHSPPDTVRCGREERLIHVKDAVIFRHLEAS